MSPIKTHSRGFATRAAWPALGMLAILAGLSLGALGWKRARSLRAGALAKTHAAARAEHPRPGVLRVPHAAGPIRVDGEVDEPAWQEHIARTGSFRDDSGALARPYSDARAAWDAATGSLYLTLYAADEDIRTSTGAAGTDDAFELELGGTSFRVTADGHAIGAPAGVELGLDRDGTANDPADDDEEWVIEMKIPLAAIGLEGRPGASTHFAMRRCDTLRTGARLCGTFGGPDGQLMLE
jgi:hypothetical protein